MHRLEASAPQTGGLVIKKKEPQSPTFKVPKPSLLGLDRLAAQKRKEQENVKRLISFKDSEYDDVSNTPSADPNAVRTPDLSSVHKLNRQYREAKDETPSYGGGVSDKARNRLAELEEKDKRGVYVSSKDRKRGHDDDDSRDRRHDRYHRDDKYHDRDRDRRYDRDRNRDRDRDRRSSRSRAESSRSHATPRFKDEPKTPTSRIGGTSTASWDDDDDRVSSKRSSWDFPTPREGDNKRSEWSVRSSSSSIFRKNRADETPRPTPAHRFNAWANDRKRSGATPQTGKHEPCKILNSTNPNEFPLIFV